jgi:hypothetical protein
LPQRSVQPLEPVVQSIETQGSNAPAILPAPQTGATVTVLESTETTEAVHEETLPRSVVLAKERLHEAGEKLKKNIPQNSLEGVDFEIKASADVDAFAHNIGSALVAMMEKRKIEKSKQSHALGLVTEWAKKTIPFVETGLTIANVQARN